jgi:ketosteroid isomerase-like protein
MMKNKFMNGIAASILAIACSTTSGLAQSAIAAPDAGENFAPLEQWKNAVVAGDAAALKNFYSTNPAAEVEANKLAGGADADTNFWMGLKARSIKLEIVRFRTRPDAASVIFNAIADTPNGPVTVADSSVWLKQGDVWRLRYVTRTDAPKLKQPSDMKKDLYPDSADARAEVKEAEEKAAKEHKRVLLVFGANWCYDCHVLDLAFHRPDFAPVLDSGYEVVHVDIGPDGKKNNDLAAEFQVPLDKGVPALAVLSGDGKLVVSQKNGEFENARAKTPESLLQFLNQWKPEAR